jgi:hypothetical protein
MPVATPNNKLTPAQVRIINLLKKHRVPGTRRVAWTAVLEELPRCWQSHIVRQQVQFALDIVGAADVDELIEKYEAATN